MTVVDTSTASTATAYSNQRKVDRCQNGVLWAIDNFHSSTSVFTTSYSLDDGATWTQSTGIPNGSGSSTQSYTVNGSFFIDLDDYAHVVHKDNSDGYIYYRRGTPNVGRTAWTWSAASLIDNNAPVDVNYPDVVAHREGTGWAVHIVYSRNTTSSNETRYARLIITSAHVIGSPSVSIISANYAVNVPTFPSIDFNHTGDGKTVAGGTPHLYAAWSAGATGSGAGIRFKKATYSGGAWTWGTEREIDSTRYVAGVSTWLNCLFDGTRVVLAGLVYDGANSDLVLHERDAADTATTSRVLVDNVAGAATLLYGSSTYDGSGNVYLFGTESAAAPYELAYRKWSRATATLEARTTIDADSALSAFVSAKRGYSNSRIEFIYTDGTASPYNVVYDSITLNNDPNVPTALAVTSDVLDTTPVFSADVSDPNSSQQIKARFTIYQSDGTTVVGTVDSTLTAGAHTATKEYASALPVGNYKVAAATVDDANAVSAQTAQVAFSVKQSVEEDFVTIWNVDELVAVDLLVQWNVLVSNQKDVNFIWNVTEQAEISLELEWSIYTPWVEVSPDPESPVTWERVLT